MRVSVISGRQPESVSMDVDSSRGGGTDGLDSYRISDAGGVIGRSGSLETVSPVSSSRTTSENSPMPVLVPYMIYGLQFGPQASRGTL